jgi:hypothetical protein
MIMNINLLKQKFNLKIDGILHIGACYCEELFDYINVGVPVEKIIWVEANPEIVEENLKKYKNIIIDSFVCCDTDIGTSKLNVTNNKQSSSILDFDLHKKFYPDIKYTHQVEVINKRIDTYYKEKSFPENLKGMGTLLNNFQYIYIEVNRKYLYKDCALVDDIDNYLKQYKFERVLTSWTDQEWGDAFYIKK